MVRLLVFWDTIKFSYLKNIRIFYENIFELIYGPFFCLLDSTKFTLTKHGENFLPSWTFVKDFLIFCFVTLFLKNNMIKKFYPMPRTKIQLGTTITRLKYQKSPHCALFNSFTLEIKRTITPATYLCSVPKRDIWACTRSIIARHEQETDGATRTTDRSNNGLNYSWSSISNVNAPL